MNMEADSEGPDQTAQAQSDLGLRFPHIPEGTFSLQMPKIGRGFSNLSTLQEPGIYVGTSIWWLECQNLLSSGK